MKNFGSARILVAASLVVFAIAARWLPHPPNFTPLIAVALFSGMVFKKRYWAFIIPFAGLLISDSLIGFYEGMWANYLCFFLVGFLGVTMHRSGFNWRSWGVGSVSAALIFFVSSNFFVWQLSVLYPKTLEGLWACYAAAIPFFQNTLLSTLMYAGVLWGLYRLVETMTMGSLTTQKIDRS